MTIEIDEHGRGLVVTTAMMMVAMVTENLMAVTVPAMLAWGGNGMYNRFTHLDCWTVIMTVINQFSSADNRALKIPIRSLCSSTSCHLLSIYFAAVIGSKLLRWVRTSSPTATKE